MKLTQKFPIDLIKYPILTEKTIRLQEKNQYTFAVDIKLSKIEIKNAIENLFGVNIIFVNTLKQPVRKKRISKFFGTKPNYKKAIVKFKDKGLIDFFENSK
jgi:large subunit ribosomal protein L23